MLADLPRPRVLIVDDDDMTRLLATETLEGACAQVRAWPEGSATPILVMTALDDVDAVERAFAAGATDFLTKPLNLPLLAHRVRYLLRAAQAFHDEREQAQVLARVQRLARLAHWRVDAAGFAWACDVGAVLWPEVAASLWMVYL